MRYASPIPLAWTGTHQPWYFATDVAGNPEAVQIRSFTLMGARLPPIHATRGISSEPRPILLEPLQISISIPPASAVGFIVVIAGLFLLNGEKIEWVRRTRSGRTGRRPESSRRTWPAPFRLIWNA